MDGRGEGLRVGIESRLYLVQPVLQDANSLLCLCGVLAGHVDTAHVLVLLLNLVLPLPDLGIQLHLLLFGFVNVLLMFICNSEDNTQSKLLMLICKSQDSNMFFSCLYAKPQATFSYPHAYLQEKRQH